MVIEIELVSAGLPDAPSATLERRAARAVVVRDGRLLLLRSRHGDHKFPGGGVEPGETPQQALVRELAEECGIAGAGVGEVLVRVVERRPAREPGTVFSMVSEYFLTSPDSPVGSVATALGGYETALRLTPAWVYPDQAWRANRHLLGRWTPEQVTAELPWLPRETRVLREVAALYR